MDDILATATTLDRVLLETDEEEYDNTALQILIALRKAPLNDQAALVKVGLRLQHSVRSDSLTTERSYLIKSTQPSPRYHTYSFCSR